MMHSLNITSLSYDPQIAIIDYHVWDIINLHMLLTPKKFQPKAMKYWFILFSTIDCLHGVHYVISKHQPMNVNFKLKPISVHYFIYLLLLALRIRFILFALFYLIYKNMCYCMKKDWIFWSQSMSLQTSMLDYVFSRLHSMLHYLLKLLHKRGIH